MSSLLTILTTILTLGSGLTSAASTACTRPFLQNLTTAYISAQTSGQPSLLAPYTSGSPNLIYLENNRLASLLGGSTNTNTSTSTSASSTLSQPLKIDVARSLHDPDQCATFTELIAASDPHHPRIIHTRVVVDAATLKAVLIESVVTDEGDWLFNATGTLQLNNGEKWDVVPEGKQERREVIQAVGDAYFDRFGNTSVHVPWGAPCYRLEGGLQAKGEMNNRTGECVMVWPSTIVVPYRRYVVDVEMGAVDLFVGFPGLDRTQGNAPMPDSHLFRVEGGKIKYLHTASACVVDGCGLNGTVFGKRTFGVKARRQLRPGRLSV
ncbi:uncharacterized protein B0T15DRAFT_430975 [Chaetomium strumarium]|uniref:DUF8021 domain-containing protein n=1 Tax=Chaetomium strumarium TaxID=1170767 RepID=A0AAJ0GUG5_9PEZI|nr:hypothetical protein B0T15DRAFT_430975 [Chaetomium strumarium]